MIPDLEEGFFEVDAVSLNSSVRSPEVALDPADETLLMRLIEEALGVLDGTVKQLVLHVSCEEDQAVMDSCGL